jgi:hypothetical protein
MNFVTSLTIVISCLGLALIVVRALDSENWTRRALDIAIGTAATFAGVFLGLGLDDLRKGNEDRQFARTALHSAMIGFTEEMRLWHQDARYFPRIAISTPDPEQQRLFYESLATYISQTKLEVPRIVDDLLKNERATKSFDDVIQWTLTDQRIHMTLAQRTVYDVRSTNAQRYAAYHAILQVSASIFTEMCVQSAHLGGEVGDAEFAMFLKGSVAVDRLQALGCIPVWNAASIFNDLLNRAGRAGEGGNLNVFDNPAP